MRRVLIIDDDELILSSLADSLSERKIESVICINRVDALDAIISDIPFDAVILDWYFVLEGDSSISKHILRKLNGNHFLPVFIYTGHLADYESTDQKEYMFPQNLISAFDKASGVNELLKGMERLLSENYSLKIASVYRNKINQHFENILFELNKLQNDDLAKVLNKVYGDGTNVDWSNDFMLNLLHRSLISDSSFIGEISEILKTASNVNDGANEGDRKRIANKILYFQSQSNSIRNGDIAKIIKVSDRSVVAYGIVITPDCDLEQSSTRFIDLIELVDFNDPRLNLNADARREIKKYKHDSFYLFQSLLVNEVLTDFIAVLKSRLVIVEFAEFYNINYPKAGKRLLYSQEFILNGERVLLSLLCTKVNPYKAEFLQKLQTSNSRVGIPDIKDLLE